MKLVMDFPKPSNSLNLLMKFKRYGTALQPQEKQREFTNLKVSTRLQQALVAKNKKSPCDFTFSYYHIEQTIFSKKPKKF